MKRRRAIKIWGRLFRGRYTGQDASKVIDKIRSLHAKGDDDRRIQAAMDELETGLFWDRMQRL